MQLKMGKHIQPNYSLRTEKTLEKGRSFEVLKCEKFFSKKQ